MDYNNRNNIPPNTPALGLGKTDSPTSDDVEITPKYTTPMPKPAAIATLEGEWPVSRSVFIPKEKVTWHHFHLISISKQLNILYILIRGLSLCSRKMNLWSCHIEIRIWWKLEGTGNSRSRWVDSWKMWRHNHNPMWVLLHFFSFISTFLLMLIRNAFTFFALRQYIAELVGTALFVFAGTGSVVALQAKDALDTSGQSSSRQNFLRNFPPLFRIFPAKTNFWILNRSQRGHITGFWFCHRCYGLCYSKCVRRTFEPCCDTLYDGHK